MLAAAVDLGLTTELLAALDRSALRTRRSVAGHSVGQRRSPRAGTSIEFTDFRSYVAGDDLRRVDWNAYARLDKLLLRLYVGEEDLTVTILVDVSASMDWGRPTKSATARGVAGALAYVAANSGDRVSVAGFADTVTGRTRPLRGRRACPILWEALRGLRSSGSTDFGAVGGMARSLPRGLTVILSDFLSASDPAPAVAALRAAGQEVALVEVLAPDELRPELSGDLELRDVETGARVEITATRPVLAAYHSRLVEHREALAGLARAHGASLHSVVSDAPLQQLLLGELRVSGLLG